MQKQQQNLIDQESELNKLFELIQRNYLFFVISVVIALALAFSVNRYAIPTYEITSSLMIKEDKGSTSRSDMTDFLNSGLFGHDKNFQNELWILKSTPVFEQTVNNLDLAVNYYRKKGFLYYDAYEDAPFHILYVKDHVQPVNLKFHIVFESKDRFTIHAEGKDIGIYNFKTGEIESVKKRFVFKTEGQTGKLIETPDLSFMIDWNENSLFQSNKASSYYVELISKQEAIQYLMKEITFEVVDKQATVVKMTMRSESLQKGKDIIDEIMNVYSQQNLDRKNHTANITIGYIESQLDEISESLDETESNLQLFRSSHQLLDVSDQASGISALYMDLQNKMAELMTRKRYYDYVSDYLSTNDDFSNMVVPASMGIPDQMLNTLMSELITAQTQRKNLIDNNQEKNPLVSKLTIQIDNLRKTVSDNILAVQKTTDISIDEMQKRIRKVEGEISRLPGTQRKLGGIERKYRLNDAIYNYLLEKRAEAKITQASNLPDIIVIEPANMTGTKPVSPNAPMNYLAGLVLGLGIPFGILTLKKAFNNKVESQDYIEQITDVPVLGKILHNRHKTNNVMFEHSKSNIAESFRALRTNIEFHYRKLPKKTILVTSSTEGEGKSFNTLNLAMSYAQLDRRTILVDFDLRKPTGYMSNEEGSLIGLSSYYTERTDLESIIQHSPHEKLDYIPSGPIPPNPMELLALDKTKDLIGQLKEQYDCIVLDSPPLAQVSDAFLLMDYADVKVVVARQHYTLKKAFNHIIHDIKYKNIENVCIVLNDNRLYSDQYGYGYGYAKTKG